MFAKKVDETKTAEQRRDDGWLDCETQPQERGDSEVGGVLTTTQSK